MGNTAVVTGGQGKNLEGQSVQTAVSGGLEAIP